MISDPAETERLRFLREVTQLEVRYLTLNDARLFTAPMTRGRLLSLPGEVELAERVDAFVAPVADRLCAEIDRRLPS